MKKFKLIILIICLFIVNVKADMGPPTIIEHEVMVTNKDGAVCYEGSKKTNKVIPYGTMLKVYSDISGRYINVFNDKYSCDVIYSDVSAKIQSFDINNKDVEVLTSRKAIILAKGGLNMRKGPAVSYSKIMTIPQYTVVTVTHRAGTYWYYADYNGQKGWISGMDGYIGFDGKEVLYNYKSVKVYSVNGNTVLGTIPANTEITDYIVLSGTPYFTFNYYVSYNGIKGYIGKMLYKTDGIGKIKLIKDYDVVNYETGKVTKKLTANQELEYNMIDGNTFYFPKNNLEAYMSNDYFEYVNEAKTLIKKQGYLGSGIFGEEKQETAEIIETPNYDKEPVIEENKSNNTELIIICVLSSIIGALTCLIIIKLINIKKEKGGNNEIEKE